jgi:hypothetical protein
MEEGVMEMSGPAGESFHKDWSCTRVVGTWGRRCTPRRWALFLGVFIYCSI